MTIKTCDRCGSKISTDLRATAILPMFSISRRGGFESRLESVDLCPECEKKLAEWLNNKDERNADTKD